MTKGRTLTRADLAEAVHQDVGLTRQDCAGLVERTLDLVAEALEVVANQLERGLNSDQGRGANMAVNAQGRQYQTALPGRR